MLTVSLTEAEWTQLLTAASGAPYSQVAQLFAKLTDQLIKQQQQNAAPKEEVGTGTASE